MSATVVLQGTLKADGTLELDKKVSLPAGRVQVTVQPLPQPKLQGEDWWQCMQQIRAEREAAGYPFMTEQEVQAHIEDLRSGDERLEQVYRQVPEQRQGSGPT
jgi:hypothetical protein